MGKGSGCHFNGPDLGLKRYRGFFAMRSELQKERSTHLLDRMSGIGIDTTITPSTKTVIIDCYITYITVVLKEYCSERVVYF